MNVERVQLKRVKGWRMPPNTVRVARPSVFGNPFRVLVEPTRPQTWSVHFVPRPDIDLIPAGFVDDGMTQIEATQLAVDMYRHWAEERYHRVMHFVDGGHLRGKNLACWCPLDQPCHADVLLELANS